MGCTKINAQADFKTVDQATLRLYNEQKWDSLARAGKAAIRNHVDYYYLRMRTGIAEYERKKFILASNHFWKAYRFNSRDTLPLHYLYYSSIWSNRNAEAGFVASLMPEEMRKNTARRKVLNSIYLEGGYTLSSDNDEVHASSDPETPPFPMKKNSIYAEQDIYGNNLYAHLDLSFNISNRLFLKTGYNYLNYSKIKNIQYAVVRDVLDSTVVYPWGYRNFYSFPRLVFHESFPYTLNQHEGMAEARIALPSRFRIVPYFHMIYVKYENIDPVRNSHFVTDTLTYNDSTSTYTTLNFNRVFYSFTQRDTSFFNFIAGATVEKDFSVFSVCLSGSYSNLNLNDQIQAGLSLSYYPLGNLDFYGSSGMMTLFEGSDLRFIFSQVLGLKIISRLWLECNGVYGDLTNANVNNGWIVYNNTDKIDWGAGINLMFFPSSHFEIDLAYQYFRKENPVYYFMAPQSGQLNRQPQADYHPYQTNSITGGIKWKL